MVVPPAPFLRRRIRTGLQSPNGVIRSDLGEQLNWTETFYADTPLKVMIQEKTAHLLLAVSIFVGATDFTISSYAAPQESAAKTRTKRPSHHGNAGEFMPPEVTKSSSCQAVSTNPDAECTPGAVMGISVDIVCNTSTRGRRAVTKQMKDQVYKAYGVDSHPGGAFEIDHFIPLELGGSNDIANLWPEPANPKPGFHEKDKVETALHNEVCKAKTMTLEEAQRTIATDWLKYYNEKLAKKK